VLNISAMSFGALSANAIRALNKGARLGHFAHDTGEGSISRYHRELGSGYFGCRKIPVGVDCISPARHSAFSTPIELLEFIVRLRELSGSKPVGFKFSLGHPWEFFGICKAMMETGVAPDFIVVDGGEGGTGAAPIEFTDHIGTPLQEALMLVHNTLVGLNLRDQVRIGASGKIISGFDVARTLALGADGATRRADSCSRSAAFNPCAAIPVTARPGSPPRIRFANARSWSKTRVSASTISTAIRCMHSGN